MIKQQAKNNKHILKIIREVSPTQIIAVTKKHSITRVTQALKNNITKIGENQIQEAYEKFKNFKDRKKIELHFIGKLQSNKINKAVELFDVIQTIENEKQIQKIGKKAKEIKKKQKIYIQINISKDPKKGGVLKEETKPLCAIINQDKNIELCGIMTVLKEGLEKEEIYNYYKKMKKIQQSLFLKNKKCKEISMGMSGDYKLAIQAGATQVRLGTALFGKRKNENISI
jgi:hypothetical protein